MSLIVLILFTKYQASFIFRNFYLIYLNSCFNFQAISYAGCFDYGTTSTNDFFNNGLTKSMIEKILTEKVYLQSNEFYSFTFKNSKMSIESCVGYCQTNGFIYAFLSKRYKCLLITVNF